MRRIAPLLCAALAAAPLAAQDSSSSAAAPLPPRRVLSPRDSAAVERAGRLVADGQGIAGRALLDTLISLAPPASMEYAELLYWRAAYAATAAEAERDYRRLAVEFSLSPRSEDALVALAQLEMARGDRQLALRHLERLTLEHSTASARAKAGYWAGRVYFEMNDPQRACVVLQAARAAAQDPGAGVELTNRIDYEMQKCRGVATGPGTGDSSALGRREASATSSRTTTPTPAPVAPPAAPPVSRGATTSVATGSVVAPDTAARRPAPVPAAAPSRAPSPPAQGAPATAPSSGARAYSVQIAAYDTPADAESAARRVRGRGLEARVDADGGMYKVRVGRYRTRAEAAAALRDVKGKGMRDAWVVEAAPR